MRSYQSTLVATDHAWLGFVACLCDVFVCVSHALSSSIPVRLASAAACRAVVPIADAAILLWVHRY